MSCPTCGNPNYGKKRVFECSKCDTVHELRFTTLVLDTYLEQVEEKAKKWDEWGSIKKTESIVDTNELLTLKEKARKWDAGVFNDTDNLIVEKAKKWDQVKDMQISSSGRTLQTELAVNPPIVAAGGYTVENLRETNRVKAEKLQKIRAILDGDG